MPGPIHDGLRKLLLDAPALAFELAARCGARLHGGHEAFERSSEVFLLEGREFVADGVIVAWAIVDGKRTEVDAVVIEIQLEHDPRKRFSWVVYRAGVRVRHRCRGWTLVLSPDPDVRERARQIFEFEPELLPLIVEPDMIPQIVDLEQARREPQLTILSAFMHSRSDAALACGRAALAAVLAISPEHRPCYLDLVSHLLTEDQMAEAAQQYPRYAEHELSKMERESYAYAKVRQGREEAREEDREEVRAALLRTLAGRGVELDETSRAQIEQCKDLRQLAQLLVRAATASSAADLFR